MKIKKLKFKNGDKPVVFQNVRRKDVCSRKTGKSDYPHSSPLRHISSRQPVYVPYQFGTVHTRGVVEVVIMVKQNLLFVQPQCMFSCRCRTRCRVDKPNDHACLRFVAGKKVVDTFQFDLVRRIVRSAFSGNGVRHHEHRIDFYRNSDVTVHSSGIGMEHGMRFYAETLAKEYIAIFQTVGDEPATVGFRRTSPKAKKQKNVIFRKENQFFMTNVMF